MTAGDELKKLVQRSGGPTPDGTLQVSVSGEIGWERLAYALDELFEKYDPADVDAVGLWRDSTRLGFVARELYRHKVYPELGDHTNEMAAIDDASLAGEIDEVPPIHRICKYKESGRKCGQPKDFDEPPNAPEPCQNETKKGLAPHDFVW